MQILGHRGDHEDKAAHAEASKTPNSRTSSGGTPSRNPTISRRKYLRILGPCTVEVSKSRLTLTQRRDLRHPFNYTQLYQMTQRKPMYGSGVCGRPGAPRNLDS